MARPRIDAVVAAVALIGACRNHAAARQDRVAVPTITAAITVDGEQAEPDWNRRAPRVQLAAGGDLARPYSEARFLRDDEHLLVGLYAADEDVRSSDAIDVTIGTLALRIDPRGRMTPAVPGARAAVELDEDTTVDQPDDFDEEWVVELAIPLAAIGGLRAPTQIRIARCDTPKDGVERCGSWSGMLTP